MQLDSRLSKLEKQRGIGGAILAIITVPQDSEDLFEKAKLFWEKEKSKYPQVNATYALPLPCYGGTETKFVGIGTYDDYYFLLCWGVRDVDKCKFIFLNEVEQLIKKHWKELRQWIDSQRNKHAGLESFDDTELSPDVSKILDFVGGKHE